MKKLTPNLIVESVEECLRFWVDRLGFTKTVEVPEDDHLGFVILKRGDLELMLQSRGRCGSRASPQTGRDRLHN